jgi:hypothetical protein
MMERSWVSQHKIMQQHYTTNHMPSSGVFPSSAIMSRAIPSSATLSHAIPSSDVPKVKQTNCILANLILCTKGQVDAARCAPVSSNMGFDYYQYPWKVICDRVIYLIRRATEKLKASTWRIAGTWETTKAVYNYIAPKEKSLDAVRSAHHIFMKNKKAVRDLENEIKQGKWAKMDSIVRKLLLQEEYPVS